MTHDTLELTLPRSWDELDDRRLRYAYALKHAGLHTPGELRALCLLRFAGLHPAPGRAPDGCRLVRQGRRVYCVPVRLLAVAADGLSFLDGVPDVPVRLSVWKGHKAASPMLYEVDFGTYLQLENYWQSFLVSHDEGAVDRMSVLLYDGLAPQEAADGLLRYAVACWFAALKEVFSDKFPHLFRHAGGADAQPPDMAAVMNAELRALTGGDVTREQAVRAVGCWRALEELNAKAREAEEFNRKSR